MTIALGVNVAHAATYELGTLGPVPVTSTNPVTGSFSDILNFDVAAPNNIVGTTLSNLPVSFTFGNSTFDIYKITGLTASLYSGSDAQGSLLSTFVGGAGYSGLMSIGQYSVKVSGNATGSSGGMYSFTAVAVPVPEPETYAMFLAGLGLMGLIVRRRKVV